jgi:hypothetical protein
MSASRSASANRTQSAAPATVNSACTRTHARAVTGDAPPTRRVHAIPSVGVQTQDHRPSRASLEAQSCS